ncbi:MAG TPA: SUMF1/EgtB/PvdO family nonheme iron enzyme [Planctomycetota bacterium]|nr:SUMF1/EgtB/PvdO family nonheme iron enzyme [Planctomycetota bacterium]
MQSIAGSTLAFEMVPVPAGSTSIVDPAEPTGSREVAVDALWISRTEIPWPVYDAFVYGLDEPAGAAADALARPSKPYISMDRGFGHDGYPAISMSFLAAQSFCAWLSAKTGRSYRLPTEAEWQHACEAGSAAAAPLAERAWFRENSGGTTHAVATKLPDALGLFDLAGNAAEWCASADGKGVLRGGSFLDPAGEVGCAARKLPTPAWNASDPQFPKSRWWLADAPFAGFRVVCER